MGGKVKLNDIPLGRRGGIFLRYQPDKAVFMRCGVGDHPEELCCRDEVLPLIFEAQQQVKGECT